MIDAVLSYGHFEYAPPFTDDEAVQVWPPATWTEDEQQNLFDAAMGQDGNTAHLDRMWDAATDLPTDRRPDADMGWERIVRIRCSVQRFRDVFEIFCHDIDIEPSGDDDVFDYWPSGARLLIAMGEELGTTEAATAIEIVRSVILEGFSDWATELLLKTGTLQDGDPQ